MTADRVPNDGGLAADLYRVLDTLTGGMMVVGADDGVTYTNAEFRRSFASAGPVVTSAIGRTGTDVLDALAGIMADPLAYCTRVHSLIAGGAAAFEHVTTADGRTFERDYLPVRGGGHLWQYWDITASEAARDDRERRLRAELAAQQLGVHAQRSRAAEAEATGQHLAERNRELQEIDLLRKELLATASHELRSPLIAILNYSHMLAEDAADAAVDGTPDAAPDDVATFSAAITRNATRLLDLVDDLLLVARLDAGARTLERKDVDLSALVHDAVQDAAGIGAPDGVTLDANIDPGLTVSGDADALTRAAGNLLSNAVKYSYSGGSVHVALKPRGDGSIALIVTDAGIGIPSDEMGALFGQFFRASTARTSGRPGTGLGLAIARSIADQHGGSIMLSSRVGAGTVATLTIPAA